MALGIISLVSSIILMCYVDSFFEIGVTGFILGPVFFIVGGVLLSKPTYESNDAEEENNEGKNI